MAVAGIPSSMLDWVAGAGRTSFIPRSTIRNRVGSRLRVRPDQRRNRGPEAAASAIDVTETVRTMFVVFERDMVRSWDVFSARNASADSGTDWQTTRAVRRQKALQKSHFGRFGPFRRL